MGPFLYAPYFSLAEVHRWSVTTSTQLDPLLLPGEILGVGPLQGGANMGNLY